MRTAFEIIGIAATIGAVALVIIIIKEFLVDIIKKAKWRYKYKHRFDKPPLAKCYCKDCVYCMHGQCTSFGGMGVAENWFCWKASPTKYETVEKK